MTDDNETEEVRVDAGGSVEEEQAPNQQPALNKTRAKEEVTRLIEVCAQSGIPPEDVEEVLRERADATEILYEGMQRYGERPEQSE